MVLAISMVQLSTRLNWLETVVNCFGTYLAGPAEPVWNVFCLNESINGCMNVPTCLCSIFGGMIKVQALFGNEAPVALYTSPCHTSRQNCTNLLEQRL